MYRNIIFNLILFLFSTSIALVAGELLLRIAAPHDMYHSVYPNLNYRTPNTKGKFPGLSDSITVTSNEFGYRSPSYFSKSRYGILALGGSTTICLALNDHETWTYVLEKKLNTSLDIGVTIGNAGHTGFNSAHHYLQLKHLEPQFEGIKMVLVLVGINDYLRFFALGNDYFTTQQDTTLFRTSFVRYPRTANKHWYQRTEWWMHLRDFKNYRLFKNRFNTNDDKLYRSILERMEAYKQAKKVDKLPNLDFLLEDYTKNLRKIAQLAKSRHLELVFITQPTLWKTEMDSLELSISSISPKLIDGIARTPTANARGMKLLNDQLAQIAKEEKVHLIDLASFTPKDTSVFYDHCHYNISGAQKIADILFPTLDSLIRSPKGIGK